MRIRLATNEKSVITDRKMIETKTYWARVYGKTKIRSSQLFFHFDVGNSCFLELVAGNVVSN